MNKYINKITKQKGQQQQQQQRQQNKQTAAAEHLTFKSAEAL